MEDAIRARAEQAIGEKVFPGCAVGLIRANRRIVVPVGTLDGTSPVKDNTIYDVASIIKSIPVASLALILAAADPRKLNFLGKVVDYLPELRNDRGATVEDLLRYRVVGPRMSQLSFKTFEEIRTYIFEHGFDLPRRSLGEGGPAIGTYTNLPAFLLGIILERVTGKILPALAHEYFFEPLGMRDTTFFPHDLDRVAPTEIVGGVEIRGIVHDESARVFSRARRAVGHAGLFSTVPDLLKFLETLLISGFTKSRYAAIVEGAQQGLGWEVNREWMGSARSGLAVFGKTGFTGTSILCDMEKGIGLVILSNRTYPQRPSDNSAINTFRKDIADIVLA
jgi:CubicO group peptidase (beta-lactamase class C family)